MDRRICTRLQAHYKKFRIPKEHNRKKSNKKKSMKVIPQAKGFPRKVPLITRGRGRSLPWTKAVIRGRSNLHPDPPEEKATGLANRFQETEKSTPGDLALRDHFKPVDREKRHATRSTQFVGLWFQLQDWFFLEIVYKKKIFGDGLDSYRSSTITRKFCQRRTYVAFRFDKMKD